MSTPSPSMLAAIAAARGGRSAPAQAGSIVRFNAALDSMAAKVERTAARISAVTGNPGSNLESEASEMTTATIEVVPVVMTTADGESRPADMWGHGSWTCAFCQTPVFSPEDWQEHEQSNADIYAKRGEAYTWEPYADYRRGYWERRECANPGCLTWLNAEALAGIRRQQADRKRREDERQREDDRRKAEARAAEDARKLRTILLGEVHATALELGFAWACTKQGPAPAYGEAAVSCMAQGWDRSEYTAHLKSHGARALSPSVKRIKLRKCAPAASHPKLEVDPFTLAQWHQEHTPEATCRGCQHTINQHKAAGSTINGTAYDCRECDCAHVYFGDFTRHETQEADRRGQYLANGPAPHSVWVIPCEPAPWEDGKAEPVLLYVGKSGRYFTEAYSAKYDRR